VRNAPAAFKIAPMHISRGDFQIAPGLTLPEDEVHLWRVDLEALRTDESRWQKLLSSDEAARAARFHSPLDRNRFAASRALLRLLLGSYLQTDPDRLSFSYSKKEKPYLAPPHSESGISFNISHSGEVALLAFARRREIGVDVEQLHRNIEIDSIARRFFSLHEQQQLAALRKEEQFDAFFRCWTRKEAYIKATGEGLSLPLDQFDVSIAVGDADALIATRPDASAATLWSIRDIPAGAGYVGAICVRGRDWRLKDWTSQSLQNPR
jgi:4'-phosphopantetheinyl transferase